MAELEARIEIVTVTDRAQKLALFNENMRALREFQNRNECGIPWGYERGSRDWIEGKIRREIRALAAELWPE